MDREKLLLLVVEELVNEAAERIGWEMDGSEVDYVTSMPQWEEATKGFVLKRQLTDIIEVVELWARETKKNWM